MDTLPSSNWSPPLFQMILMMNSFNMMTSCLGPEVATLSGQWTTTGIETLKLYCMHTPTSKKLYTLFSFGCANQYTNHILWMHSCY